MADRPSKGQPKWKPKEAPAEGKEGDEKEVGKTRKGKSQKERVLEQIRSLHPENDDERTTISKKISWILRHGAKQGLASVPMDSSGWVKISDLLKADVLDEVDEETLMAVIVDSNGKKLRYELKETSDGTLIKAYSKDERSKMGDPTTASKGTASLRRDAPDFVPSQPVQGQSPTAANMYPMMSAYQWPFFGFPMMPGMGTYPFPVNMATSPDAIAAAMGRYRGKIKSFNAEKGFGFIDCDQTRARYNRDVFVHKAQIGDLKVGADVYFSVEMNKQGMPQGKDLQKLSGSALALVGTGKAGKGTGKGKSKDKDKDGKEKPTRGRGKAKAKPEKGDGKEPLQAGEVAAAENKEEAASGEAPAAAEASASEAPAPADS